MVRVLTLTTDRASGVAASEGGLGVSWTAWRRGSNWEVALHARPEANIERFLVGAIRQAILYPEKDLLKRMKGLFTRRNRVH